MEKFKISLNELITIGSIVVSVTAAYTLLKADVNNLKKDVGEVKTEVDATKVVLDKIQEEQFRMNLVLNFVYGEGVREGWVPSKYMPQALELGITEKPWRNKDTYAVTPPQK